MAGDVRSTVDVVLPTHGSRSDISRFSHDKGLTSTNHEKHCIYYELFHEIINYKTPI